MERATSPPTPLRIAQAPTTFFRLLFWSLMFSSISLAQDPSSITSTTASHSTTTSGSSASITSGSSSRPHSTLFKTTSASNSSSSSAPTQPSRPGLAGTDSIAGTVPEDSQHSSGLLNYYFAFLAVFVILLFGAIWFIHRRKKKLKALRASSRQTALTRDLDGWTGSRRWIGGAWRGGIGRRDARTEDREEGLNELGEAPPPYKARNSGGGREMETQRQSGESAGPSLTVPLRALDREGRAVVKPPGYETVRELPDLPEDEEGPSESSRGDGPSSSRSAEPVREDPR